jgi:hypothetical protein
MPFPNHSNDPNDINDPNDPQGLPMQSIRIHSRTLYSQLSPPLPRSVERQGVAHFPRAAPERRRGLRPPGRSSRVQGCEESLAIALARNAGY